MHQITYLWKIISVCGIMAISKAVVPSAIEEPIVRTTLGNVKGTIMTSQDNGSFYAFRGIPYAKPPLGNLRFQNPVVADPWNDVYDATIDALPCSQYYFLVPTSENCLVVNVYSKKLPSPHTRNLKLLPVLVFIHPGGFAVGAAVSYLYFPEAIMNRDVVFVSIAYRLGPFGFLSTGDSAAYGNVGMLDQVMALKWVQANVAAFGGDPKRVAVYGESSGAVSVSLLLLSPLSKGLFQAAISGSGSSLCPWAIQKNPLEYAIELGRPFNCSKDNTSLLVECLRQQSAIDLVYSANNFSAYNQLYLPFVPVVETPHKGAFLQECPLKVLRERRFHKVPVISGVNKDDGLLLYILLIQKYNTTSNEVIFQSNLQEVLRIFLHDNRIGKKVTAAVNLEYFSRVDFSNTSTATRAAIDLSSDTVIKAGNDMTIRLLAAGGSTVYMYVFDYAGSGSTSNLTGTTEINHGDELYYLFYANQTMTASDMRISNTMIDMWINFANYRNPTPVGSKVKWTPTPIGTIHYLRIADNITMKKNYLPQRMHFWNVVVPILIDESNRVK